MSAPLVTVICICYNHARFVEAALDSVINQTYKDVELIVIDDGSTDGSPKIIKRWIANHPETTLLLNVPNLGYCKTFNKAYRVSKGEYIIDLAADDLLHPYRIEVGLKAFNHSETDYGVTFSDAEHIDEQGNLLRLHSDKYPNNTIPSGDIYKDVINRYFICSPTMMFRRSVIEQLNGYDESLAYEDFDFWVRASREFRFVYTPQVLLKKRSVANSMSKNQFKKSSAQRWSTFKVCQKIKQLNTTIEEKDALKQRVRYEIKLSVKLLDIRLGFAYFKLFQSL